MRADCCGAAAGHRSTARRGGRGQRIPSLLALAPAALLAIAVPKCPLCLAAQLALLGVGMGTAAAITPLVSPLAIALAVLALGLLLRASPVGTRCTGSLRPRITRIRERLRGSRQVPPSEQ